MNEWEGGKWKMVCWTSGARLLTERGHEIFESICSCSIKRRKSPINQSGKKRTAKVVRSCEIHNVTMFD